VDVQKLLSQHLMPLGAEHAGVVFAVSQGANNSMDTEFVLMSLPHGLHDLGINLLAATADTISRRYSYCGNDESQNGKPRAVKSQTTKLVARSNRRRRFQSTGLRDNSCRLWFSVLVASVCHKQPMTFIAAAVPGLRVNIRVLWAIGMATATVRVELPLLTRLSRVPLSGA
jgi:hypothetical protein